MKFLAPPALLFALTAAWQPAAPLRTAYGRQRAAALPRLAAARKDQWRAALRRFHPDKFQRVLAAAAPGDRSRILERCKAVTRRIIDERALL